MHQKRKEEADSKAACKLLALEAEDSKAACKVLALEAAYERVHLHRKAQAMAEQLRIEKERLLEKCIGESTPPKNLRSGYYR